MTRRVILAALLAAAIGGSAALAETPAADWLSPVEITKKLTESGYSHVTGLKADDGYWEGKGLKDGKLTEFKADPRTGEIVEEEFED
jgi:hypothetical protein